MALKRTEKEISYASKVGVNRGTGFANLAQASERRSAVFDKMADTFATKSLQEIKTKGAEEGGFAGQEYQFRREEKEITDPNNPDQKITINTLVPITRPENLNTRSSQQAFDKIVYERYIDEIDNDIKQLTLKERDNSLRENGTVNNFESIVNPQLDVIFNEISSTSVEAVARNLADKYLIQYGAEVDNNHQKFISDLDSSNSQNRYSNNYGSRLTEIIYGPDKEEAKEMVSKTYEDWKTASDAGMKWAQGYDIMSDLEQLDANYTIQSTLNPFLQGNFETDDRLYSQYRARNYQQVINLLDGGQTQAVLQQVIDGEIQQKTITMDDIKGFTKAQYQTMANTYGTLERELSGKITDGDFGAVLNGNSIANGKNPVLTYGGTISQRNNHLSDNKRVALNNYTSGNDDNFDPIGYNNYTLFNYGTLDARTIELIEAAFIGNNVDAFNDLKANDFFAWASQDSRTINSNGTSIKVQFNPIQELGLANVIPDATVSMLQNFMEDVKFSNNIDEVFERRRILKSDDTIKPNLGAFKQRNNIDDNSIDKQILKAIPDNIKDLEGIKGGLDLIPIYIKDDIMNQIDRDISSNTITNANTFYRQVDFYTKKLLNNIGVSKYVIGGPALGDTGYFLANNFEDQTTQYLKYNDNGVLELVNDDKWLTQLLIARIKESDNYKDADSDFNLLTDDEYVLGENLFLQSTGVSDIYNIMFNDDIGIPIMIEQDSFPIPINLGSDGTSLYDQQGKMVVRGKTLREQISLNARDKFSLGNDALQRSRTEIYIPTGDATKESTSLLNVRDSYTVSTTKETDFDLAQGLSNANKIFYEIITPEFAPPKFMDIITNNIVSLNRELTNQELIIFRDTGELPEDVVFE